MFAVFEWFMITHTDSVCCVRVVYDQAYSVCCVRVVYDQAYRQCLLCASGL